MRNWLFGARLTETNASLSNRVDELEARVGRWAGYYFRWSTEFQVQINALKRDVYPPTYGEAMEALGLDWRATDPPPPPPPPENERIKEGHVPKRRR